jgi:hypothetical protein
MNFDTKPVHKKSIFRVAANCGIVLLVILVIVLPFYIRWRGSNLSYTPEPAFVHHPAQNISVNN